MSKQKTNTQQTLKAKIDEYGLLKEQVKELEKKAEELGKELKELPEGIHFGDIYQIEISKRTTQVLDPIEVFKKIGKDIFNVVTIVKKDLQKYLSDREIDECIKEIKETKYISAKKYK